MVMPNTDTTREQGFPLRNYLETVFRHKNKALLFFLATAAAAVIALAFASESYTSTAKLLIRRGRENVGLDPTTATGVTLPLYKEWTSELNSELEILSSRELAEEVVRSLGPDAFLSASETERGGRLSPIREALSPVRHWMKKVARRFRRDEEGVGAKMTGRLDKIVEQIQENLQIHVQERSDIISVSYTSANPQLAQQVVTLLIDRYFEKRIDVRRTPGAYQFFTEQREQLLNELHRTDEAIRSIKEKAGILSPEESRLALQDSLAAVQTQQLNNQSALAAASARVEMMRTMLQQQGSSERKAPGGAILNPAEREELQAALRLEETTQAALTAEGREISRQLVELRNQLAAVEALETPIRNLRREQMLLEEKYRQYSENQEQARINQALETEKISNVSIVQQATLPARPNPSRNFFKLLSALLAGLLGALAIVIGADWIDPTLHSAADICRHLHLPALMEIPDVRRQEINPFTAKPEKGRRPDLSGSPLMDVKECFQELGFKIVASCEHKGNRPLAIGITGSSEGEGVSTVASNLAAAFARDSRFNHPLLLDANQNPLPVEWTSRPVGFTYQHLRSAPKSEESGLQKAGSEDFIHQLDRIRKQSQHDIIVVDLPPVSESGDSLQTASGLDIVILTARASRTPWRTVQRAVGMLTDIHASFGGIVLNRRRFPLPAWIYNKL